MEWASLKPHKSIEYTNTQTHTYMYWICWVRHGPENATYWPPCDTSFPQVKDFSPNPNWAQYRLMSPLNMRSRGFWPLIFWGPISWSWQNHWIWKFPHSNLHHSVRVTCPSALCGTPIEACTHNKCEWKALSRSKLCLHYYTRTTLKVLWFCHIWSPVVLWFQCPTWFSENFLDSYKKWNHVAGDAYVFYTLLVFSAGFSNGLLPI